MERQILVNQIRTPDGTLLISHHRHDYRTYVDKNGLEYMVDGGEAYLRRNIHRAIPENWFFRLVQKIAGWFNRELKDPAAYEELSLYTTDPIEVLRENIHRGGRGVDGTEELKYVLVKDMSNEWIENVILYEKRFRPDNRYINVFILELLYRVDNNIYIKD